MNLFLCFNEAFRFKTKNVHVYITVLNFMNHFILEKSKTHFSSCNIHMYVTCIIPLLRERCFFLKFYTSDLHTNCFNVVSGPKALVSFMGHPS